MIDTQPSIALWQHAIALVLVCTDIFARGARSAALIPVSLTRAMMVNCAGDAVAAVTPARAGGDALRYVWFTRLGIAATLVLASFATENAVNTVVLVGGGVLLLIFFREAMWSMISHALNSATNDDVLRLVGAIVGVGVVIGYVVHQRYPQLSRRVGQFLVDTWRAFRATPRRAIVWSSLWTVVSMVARTAILPALLITTPGINPSSLAIGSVLTLYALLLSPTPGGLGAIEAGFFAGFHGRMDAGHIGELLVVWRAYAWISSAAVGALLLILERVRRPARD